LPVEIGDVDGVARLAQDTSGATNEDLSIRTRKRHITARTPVQATYLKALQDAELVFALGPAGTGKTYMAVAKAVALKLSGAVDRIILSRPAVEAGERLGFLPGDMREKIDPYLRPLYDALYDMLPGDYVAKLLLSGEIEVAPLAFMRGRTLTSAFIILDEAQNTTPVQMKMALTRMGENSRMVVTGDLSQVDLPRGMKSGLEDALETLGNLKGVGHVRFTHRDVVRHDLVTRIVEAYDKRDAQRKKAQSQE
jgi:phosphate starvation-inducible PhoH-like protein